MILGRCFQGVDAEGGGAYEAIASGFPGGLRGTVGTPYSARATGTHLAAFG